MAEFCNPCIYNLVNKKRLKYKEIYQVKNLWQRPSSHEIVKAWEQVFSELEKLILAVHNNGMELAVIIYPYREQLKQAKTSYPQDMLGGFLNKHRIHFLDMLPIYREEEIGPDQIFMDSNHFTPLGNARTALYIHKFLLDNRLIPVGTHPVSATNHEN